MRSKVLYLYCLQPSATRIAAALKRHLTATGKVLILKQAKEEAEAEIALYKKQREEQFQVFAKERTGNTTEHSKGTQAATDLELQTIARQACLQLRCLQLRSSPASLLSCFAFSSLF